MTKDESETSGAAGSAVGAVSALMDERRRYESWMSALDQKRASTPDHVFTRVRADYQSRLDAVVAKLATHADGLRQEIESLTARFTTIRDEHQLATDERAEAELRAHVGELTEQEWQKVSSESDSKLGDLTSRGNDIEQELARTRGLLDDTQRPTPAKAAPEVVTAAAVPEPAPAPAALEETAPAAVSDVAEAEVHVAAEPEPAPASIVAAAPIPQPEMLPLPSSAPAPRSSTSVPQPRTSGNFDELSFLRSVVESPAGPVEPAPRDEPDEASKLDSFARRSREDSVQRLTGEQPLIMRSSGEELSRDGKLAFQRTPGSALDPVKDPAVEGAKTLKCGECGSLNYPTEWYCERCGAELASL